jgi:tetratricopeptide (TPR) repeat protein
MTSADPAGSRKQHAENEFDSAAETRNELGGVVYGSAILARNVGGVHIHEAALSLLPPPNQLPPPVRLTGRAGGLATLDAARESRLALITGQPGVGKTALAVSWAHAIRGDYQDGALFADLHGYAADGPANVSDVLGRFLRALGVDPRQVSGDLAELTDLFRSLMIDRRMLVVLDDALSAAQIVPLLPSSAESMAVVTSRVRIGGLAARGGRVVQLDGLDPDAGLELLARMIGEERIRAHPHAASKLVDLCGRVPLALCVAGARLAARPKWPVSEMVDAMVHERERLAALRMEDEMAVRSALDISYGALPASAARMYRLMGLWPGVHFDSEVAAATAVVSRAAAKRLLGTLTDANLLDDTAGGRYRFHDLTRLHAHDLAHQAEPAPAREEAIRRMLDWCLAAAGSASLTVTPYRGVGDIVLTLCYQPAEPPRFASPSAALDWLDRELPNVLAAARMAASHRHWSVAWQLADVLWPVFLYRGRQAERLEFDRLGLDAARAGGDALGEAKMLYRLGTALINAGEHDQAEARIEEARDAWQRLGRPDRVAGSVRRLGYLALARGRAEGAVEWFGQAVTDYRELGDARHLAVTLGDLADALIATSRPREAIEALEEAGRLLVDSPDPHSQGRLLTRLGLAYELAGNSRAAGEYLDQSLRAMREIGSRRGEADALVALGDLAGRAGRSDEARTRYAEAQRVLVSLGSPEEARIRDRLAELDRPGQA